MNGFKKGNTHIVKIEYLSGNSGVVKGPDGNGYVQNVDAELVGEWVKAKYTGNKRLELISEEVPSKDHVKRLSGSHPAKEDFLGSKNDILNGHT
ncbi:hypothetical protein [Natrinema caseinilyticum]|uniref:hypothetical protein n=1 Tax=Natrinema caseinilyticum TaxID=2961570 RepID=UPI0020C26D70|nr:hypothetical protein [Natrinema caseinilyticum]